MTYKFPQLKSSLSLEEIEIDRAIDKLCVYCMHDLSKTVWDCFGNFSLGFNCFDARSNPTDLMITKWSLNANLF